MKNKKCPNCGNSISEDEVKCRVCSADLHSRLLRTGIDGFMY